MSSPFVDRVGQQFGQWTVDSFAEYKPYGGTVWNCRCSCGEERKVIIGSLLSGRSKSCGCTSQERRTEKCTKHGLAGTPTYKSWHAMIQRSEGKGGHESYQVRHIEVCDEWMDFKNFYTDMGERPNGKTLDRIDNSKGYYKENCRWSTRIEQQNNRDTNVYITAFGETMTVAEAARHFDIGISCLRHRLRKGIDPEIAVMKESMR